jgi:hypothetical protein
VSHGCSTASPASARSTTTATNRVSPARQCFDALHEYLAARADVVVAEHHVDRRAAVERHVAALDALQLLARYLAPLRDDPSLDQLTAQRLDVIRDIARIHPLAASARTYDDIYATATALNTAIDLATTLDALGPDGSAG